MLMCLRLTKLCYTAHGHGGVAHKMDGPKYHALCDEPRYCNKNVATPKASEFNYQPGVCTNLRGIGTIFASYKVSSL